MYPVGLKHVLIMYQSSIKHAWIMCMNYVSAISEACIAYVIRRSTYDFDHATCVCTLLVFAHCLYVYSYITSWAEPLSMVSPLQHVSRTMGAESLPQCPCVWYVQCRYASVIKHVTRMYPVGLKHVLIRYQSCIKHISIVCMNYASVISEACIAYVICRSIYDFDFSLPDWTSPD